MFKILGTDDAVNSCDCCGKKNLKYTVVVDVDGDILHYGSTCATRHTGKTSAQIKSDIEKAETANLDAAIREYRTSAEHVALQAAQRKAHAAKLLGKAFKEFCENELNADAETRKRIASKFGVEVYKVN